jgi:hypothetical protein
MTPIFSVPINPKLNQAQFDQFLQFLTKYKPWIYDLYFTCRMPPFIQDAMGDVFISDSGDTIDVALKIQEFTGIPISATFNNTMIRPSQHNLDLFIGNFKLLYDAGVRSATIPHTHWLATKQIQTAFPELNIKNTILRNVNTPMEVAKLAEAGFHYVNLERDLMRDRDTLIKMKRVATKYNIKLSLLANEGCVGGCAMMDEHFQFNNTRQGELPQYFNDPISRVSCPKWDKEDPSTPLKTANFTPWREDWDELLEYVDVIKMHGRESVSRLFETMDIISRYANNEDILFDTFNEYINETNLVNKPINAWRDKIKNCKFDCWDCNFCDKLYETKSKQQSHPLILAVTKELVDSVNCPVDVNVQGLTSVRVQQLLFALSQHCTQYLEIGSALGATAGAVALNPNIKIDCVDNWSQPDIQPESGLFDLPINSRAVFETNVQHTNLVIHDQDLLAVDVDKIANVDLFFYDGPHDEETVTRAVVHYKDCLAEYAILIFDDANWTDTVVGANQGIEQAGLTPVYSKMMLNSKENPGQWWNGLYILVVKK